ncbi:MAG: AsnC family protein [Candidatus Rokuibacteriota bacterium]
MDGWWDDIEREVLGCLSAAGELPCGELAAKLGMSEEAVASVLRVLAADGSVKITRVACPDNGRYLGDSPAA